MRPGLVVGVNVDPIDVEAGVEFGKTLGYTSETDRMVVTYALQRWARGEEEGGEKTWTRYFPRDFTSWRVILAAALAAADTKEKP